MNQLFFYPSVVIFSLLVATAVAKADGTNPQSRAEALYYRLSREAWENEKAEKEKIPERLRALQESLRVEDEQRLRERLRRVLADQGQGPAEVERLTKKLSFFRSSLRGMNIPCVYSSTQLFYLGKTGDACRLYGVTATRDGVCKSFATNERVEISCYPAIGGEERKQSVRF